MSVKLTLLHSNDFHGDFLSKTDENGKETGADLRDRAARRAPVPVRDPDDHGGNASHHRQDG